jgi:hypothetical protein
MPEIKTRMTQIEPIRADSNSENLRSNLELLGLDVIGPGLIGGALAFLMVLTSAIGAPTMVG